MLSSRTFGTILVLFVAIVVLSRHSQMEAQPSTLNNAPQGKAYLETIKSDLAFLEAGLKSPPANRAVMPLKATAMLIAWVAQENKNYAMRDQALKVAELMAKKDYSKAKVEAAKIGTMTGGEGSDLKLATAARFDIEELMTLFKPANRSGRDFENLVRQYANVVRDVKKAGDVGSHIAIIAKYTHEQPVASAGGAKLKLWQKFAKEMEQLGNDVAEEAGKASPSKATLISKFKALDANCTACHNEFR